MESLNQIIVIAYESAILCAAVLVVFGVVRWLVGKAAARSTRRRNGVEGSPPGK